MKKSLGIGLALLALGCVDDQVKQETECPTTVRDDLLACGIPLCEPAEVPPSKPVLEACRNGTVQLDLGPCTRAAQSEDAAKACWDAAAAGATTGAWNRTAFVAYLAESSTCPGAAAFRARVKLTFPP